MNYENITDVELALRMIDYIEKTEDLLDKISKVIDQHQKEDIAEVKNGYKELKYVIKQESHDLQLNRNKYIRNTPMFQNYKRNIIEASAEGFRSPVNSNVDFKMQTSLSEVRYKLQKHNILEKCKELANTLKG